ncbi:MAG: hypothetical protein M3Q17_06225 [Actinomycetota bacterium]|nr:hypothetical protein [Actinomycetota bacterium]
MDTTGWIVVAIVVVLLGLAALVLAAWQRRRSTALRSRFGPEYDRTLDASGGRRPGESDLRERVRERESLQLRPLSAESLQAYTGEWANIQQQFVDDPGRAVDRADDLARRVMTERGYPTQSFESGAAIVSVDHPEAVQRYRTAHELAVHERDEATTEQLRRAVTAYRTLLEELLTDGQPNR